MPETSKGCVLILGSAPAAVECRAWDRAGIDHIVAINNAWRVRDDWDFMIHPEDFPEDRRPKAVGPGQQIVTAADYVPVQNRFGGFVYAGGTMVFTAAYWALGALKPSVLAFWACDMVYPKTGHTHFYGTGEPDPLRADISLRSLEAKSARLALIAAREGCACVNLSGWDSRLVFPRTSPQRLRDTRVALDPRSMARAETEEARLGYLVESGRYWEEEDKFDPARIDALDALWLASYDEAARPRTRQSVR